MAALDASGAAGSWTLRPGLVRGYYPAGREDPAAAFRAAWRETAGDLPPPPTRSRPAPDADWAARWKAAVRPTPATPRLWVAPPGADPAGAPPGAIVVRIQPGAGFGTGGHPTTRALLRWLDAEPGFATVLDVGTGSGVLAIAAALLGAARAVGIDPDPEALANARGNRARNRADRVALVRGTLAAVRPAARFDRVLANLDRTTLEDDLPGLAARAAPEGRVGLAGLLETEREGIVERARAAGLALVDEVVEADDAGGDRWWSGWLRPGRAA